MSMNADIISDIEDTTNGLINAMQNKTLDATKIGRMMLQLNVEIFLSLDWDSSAEYLIKKLQSKYDDHSLDIYLDS